jgi:hypothetical protein
MQPLAQADPGIFRGVRFVLTDMDETLTHNGRLAGRTYDALERLQTAGIKVIPVTAAPAGWCDQMARMWPIDGVIGENGGFFFGRDNAGHDLIRIFWHDEKERPKIAHRLEEIAQRVQRAVPSAAFAQDQPFRLASIAFVRPESPSEQQAIVAELQKAGADLTLNSLWVLGWLGGYDKLAMSARILSACYGIDIETERGAVLYIGDSTNDAPMFGFFPHSVGVSTVTRYLSDIPEPPTWITTGPGGAGFVEAADAIIHSRRL